MLNPELYFSVLKAALKKGGEYADLFMENRVNADVQLESSKVENISTGISHGVGLRVIYGRNYIYAYGNDLSREGLLSLAESVSAAIKYGKTGVLNELVGPIEAPLIVTPAVLPGTVSIDRKVEKAFEADAAARDYSGLISQVKVKYADVTQNVVIATSEGKLVEDRRVRTRMMVNAIATEGEKKESGLYGPGKSMGFEFFDSFKASDIGHEAARIATVLLEADHAPAGKMPVVIDNGFGGVILHEAVGHALEATSVGDNASIFCGKLGEKIANECVTAIDDGTIKNEWGSINFDDEGSRSARNVLIEDGVLKSYMVDKLGSIKMDMPLTGNGRRESFRYAPTSRMTNTFISPGRYKLDDLISSVDKGIYCKNLGGGSVNPPTTDFNFAVKEAYLIENGKITKPLKGATLIGKGSEIIKEIDMVADNLDQMAGMCGSISGSVPANVGQPAIRVKGLVVGGRKE